MRFPLEALRQVLACPSLEVRVDEAWRSASGLASAIEPRDHRLALRQAIITELKAAGTPASSSETVSVLDLSGPPTTEVMSLSISHCPELGGFAWVKKPASVGFDLEVIARVSRAAIARMSRHEELAQAPSPWQLWVAKEAAFKAWRGPEQPATLSAIETGQWAFHPAQSETPKLWTFSAQCLNRKQNAPSQHAGRGVVFEALANENLGIAIFIIPLN